MMLTMHCELLNYFLKRMAEGGAWKMHIRVDDDAPQFNAH